MGDYMKLPKYCETCAHYDGKACRQDESHLIYIGPTFSCAHHERFDPDLELKRQKEAGIMQFDEQSFRVAMRKDVDGKIDERWQRQQLRENLHWF